MSVQKPGTALAIIAAEIDVIAHRAQLAAGKADKYAANHGHRSEHADRIHEWASHRAAALRATFFMVADLAQAAKPFDTLPLDEKITVNDIRRLREALARIGEVP